jgi:transposase
VVGWLRISSGAAELGHFDEQGEAAMAERPGMRVKITNRLEHIKRQIALGEVRVGLKPLDRSLDRPQQSGQWSYSPSAGKPAKGPLTAVIRKLIVLANALLKAHRNWTPKYG